MIPKSKCIEILKACLFEIRICDEVRISFKERFVVSSIYATAVDNLVFSIPKGF